MPKPRVVVVGSANADLVVRAARVPRPGETLMGSDFAVVPGGKGANQAVACSRLGAETHFIGRVGGDEFGGLLLAALKRAGVRTSRVRRDRKTPTGIAIIIVQPDGQNSIVVAPGANSRCSVEDINRSESLIAKSQALVTQLEVPIPTVERALEVARGAGVVSVLDAGPATRLPARVIRKADVISPNETEAFALTGVRVRDTKSARAAARKLLGMGARCVVMKLGEKGCLLARGTEFQHFPAVKVRPVDTTAAGDAFTAALAVKLASGAEMEEAVRFANYAGALATLTFGAQPSMPTLSHLLRFIRGHVP